MNGNHVRPKLKIRNRILAIFVAFLLLSLMIPHAVFATESTEANLNDSAKEVNNEAVANAPSNAETVSGKVTSDGSTGVSGVRVSAFKGNTRLCSSVTTEADGTFTLNLDQAPVTAGEPIMLMLNPSANYAFEVVKTTAGATDVNVALKDGVSTNVKPVSEDESHHKQFLINTTVEDQVSTQTYTETSFGYTFPVGGQFHMTDKVHMIFHYTNSLNQAVSVEFTPTGTGLYRPYYWGFIVDKNPGQLMPIGQDYNLESGKSYVVGVAYLNQTTLKASSQDANHEAFNFVFKKNGIQMHELTQPSFDTTMYVGATCTVQEDGSIKIFFDDSDQANIFVIEATITPIAKAGYKIAS